MALSAPPSVAAQAVDADVAVMAPVGPVAAPDDATVAAPLRVPAVSAPATIDAPEPRLTDRLSSPRAREAAPEPTRFTLDNGLRVVLAPVPGRRFAAAAVTYRVGSRHVPDGWTGLAHLTEHLMFSGTDVLGELEIYLRLEGAGAVDRNGETAPDRSVYYALLPAAQLEVALYLEAQRMARMLAGLTEARLERQRRVVLHEGWERGVYGWRGLLTRRLYGGVFGDGHPYERIVEREDDVHAISLANVQWFFQRHYAPDQATLVVAGGFDPAVVRAAVERHFGPIRRSGPRPEDVAHPAVAPLDHERRVTVEVQDDRDQLYLAWPTPALYAPGDAAFDVLSTLLFERRDSPLRAALIESGLALDVSVRQRSHELGSVFAVHAIPAPGHDLDELQRAVDRALDEVRRAPFGEAAVEEARQTWARRMRLHAEDLGAAAIRLATRADGPLPTIERERQRYLAVDAAEVQEVVRAWLPPRRRLVLRAVANPRAPAEGRVREDERAVVGDAR